MLQSRLCVAAVDVPRQLTPARLLRFAFLIVLSCLAYLLLSSQHRPVDSPPILDLSASAELCPTPDNTLPLHPTFILAARGESEPISDRTHWVANQDILPFRLRDDLGIDMVPFPSYHACSVNVVPSSRSYRSITWKSSDIMLGFATDVKRMTTHLPLWSHWLSSIKDVPPLLLVLTEDNLNSTEKKIRQNLLVYAKEVGVNLQITPRKAKRYQERYLMLVEEMWKAATKLEAEQGVVTEWFSFA